MPSDKCEMTPEERIASLGYQLWRASHSNTESCRELFDKMKKPKVGDFVLETSSFRRCQGVEDSLGTLVEKFVDVRQHGDSGETYEVDIWVIETLDGREVTWENCSFVTLPEERDNGKRSRDRVAGDAGVSAGRAVPEALPES